MAPNIPKNFFSKFDFFDVFNYNRILDLTLDLFSVPRNHLCCRVWYVLMTVFYIILSVCRNYHVSYIFKNSPFSMVDRLKITHCHVFITYYYNVNC